MASMTCGNCKATHGSSNEVRACYGLAPDPRRREEAYNRTQDLRDMRHGIAVHGSGPGNGVALAKQLRTALRTALAELAPGKEHVYVATLVDDTKLRFFKLDLPKRGKWATTIFVAEQAGDDLYKVRDVARQCRILDAVLADPGAALARYGKELGQCGICGKTLTDEDSRARGIGPVCYSKMGAMV